MFKSNHLHCVADMESMIKYNGWTFMRRPDLKLTDLIEVKGLGQGTYGKLRPPAPTTPTPPRTRARVCAHTHAAPSSPYLPAFKMCLA